MRKWYVGLPVVLAVAIMLWQVLHLDGLAIASLATIATAIMIARMPTYIIVTLGRHVAPEGRSAIRRPRKESRWFLVLLFSVVAVILTILIWSIWSSL